ncbi:MAG: DUF4058 family protein [Planctomycetota bacterium]
MPSPFPGMNPWLENAAVWQTFHSLLMSKLAVTLEKQVAPKFYVNIGRDVFLTNFEGERVGRVGPDVSLASPPTTSTPAESGSAAISAPATAILEDAQIDPPSQGFLEVRTDRDDQIVTVIELLSPANKRPGKDRDGYEAKRRSLLHGWVNLVEVDLLRGFGRMGYSELPPCDYAVGVLQPTTRREVAVWPVGLRDRLPVFPVPLGEGDTPARLDLQALVDATYDEAGFHRHIYRHQPTPMLPADDLAWATNILERAGIAYAGSS